MSRRAHHCGDSGDANSPERVGAGYWSIIHRIASKARTMEEQEAVVREIRRLSKLFPCPACREHWAQYMRDYPPENSIGEGFDGTSAIFEYTWKFHNAVNLRTGKCVLSWRDAKGLYY